MSGRQRVIAFAEQAKCVDRPDLFTAEHFHVTAGALRAMQRICDACPVFDLCAQLRDETEPTCGVWAGQLCRPERGR